MTDTSRLLQLSLGKRAAIKKAAATQISVSGKQYEFVIPQADISDLAAIDKYMNEALAHPHILITELQRVAKETCGIPPLEVTKELLLAEGGTNQDKGSSSNNLQIVLYGL
jgi:hypothetical protein